MRHTAIVLALFLACPAAWAGDGAELPIRSGRWSSGNCASRSEATTRFFKPGWTSTLTNSCAVSARSDGARTYRAHLTCGSEGDDVVLKVASPTSLTWINQCLATEYRFCR